MTRNRDPSHYPYFVDLDIHVNGGNTSSPFPFIPFNYLCTFCGVVSDTHDAINVDFFVEGSNGQRVRRFFELVFARALPNAGETVALDTSLFDSPANSFECIECVGFFFAGLSLAK